MQPAVVRWERLLPAQRQAFLRTLQLGLKLLLSGDDGGNGEARGGGGVGGVGGGGGGGGGDGVGRSAMDFLVRRGGEFDRAVDAPRVLLTENVLVPFLREWRDCCEDQTLPEVYGNALQMLAEGNVLVAGSSRGGAAAAPPPVPFLPDSYGAADLRVSQAMILGGVAGR